VRHSDEWEYSLDLGYALKRIDQAANCGAAILHVETERRAACGHECARLADWLPGLWDRVSEL